MTNDKHKHTASANLNTSTATSNSNARRAKKARSVLYTNTHQGKYKCTGIQRISKYKYGHLIKKKEEKKHKQTAKTNTNARQTQTHGKLDAIIT